MTAFISGVCHFRFLAACKPDLPPLSSYPALQEFFPLSQDFSFPLIPSFLKALETEVVLCVLSCDYPEPERSFSLLPPPFLFVLCRPISGLIFRFRLPFSFFREFPLTVGFRRCSHSSFFPRFGFRVPIWIGMLISLPSFMMPFRSSFCPGRIHPQPSLFASRVK